MFIVEFENSKEERREIGVCDSFDNAYPVIKKFLDEHDYKAPYYRWWSNPEGNERIFDIGSWSEFFYVREVNNHEIH